MKTLQILKRLSHIHRDFPTAAVASQRFFDVAMLAKLRLFWMTISFRVELIKGTG